MFEMKYDKDGQPIKNPNLVMQQKVQEQQVIQEPEQVEPVIEEQVVEQQVQEEVETVQEQPKYEPITAQESDRERNIRELRNAKLRAERERDEILKRMQDLEAAKHTSTQEDDLNVNINDDDLSEGRHLKQVVKNQQKLKSEIKQQQEVINNLAAETRLKKNYPDIDEVLTPENIRRLEEEDPIEAEALVFNPNYYNRKVLAYRRVKQLGIYKEDSKDLYQNQKEIVHKNASKPKPLASISPQQSDSPLSRANAFANGLTDDLKTQLWKEIRQFKNS